MIDEAIIYAAGLGTRMKELVHNTPKPLLEIYGESFLMHSLNFLKAGGIKKIHVNGHYHAEKIAAHIAPLPDVEFFHEEYEALETGGTLKALASTLPEAVFTMNSDGIFYGENPLNAMREAWHEGIDALLLLAKTPANSEYFDEEKPIRGDFFYDAQKHLHQPSPHHLKRRGEMSFAPYIYTGLQIIRPKLAEAVDKNVFSNNEIYNQLLENGRIDALIYEGEWKEFGTKARYLHEIARG